MTATTYWLVQRLKTGWRRDNTNLTFDDVWRLDYMGSSEYEWGAPGESLRAIRAQGPATVTEIDITHGGVTRPVYFVHTAAVDINEMAAGMRDWLAIEGRRSQERAWFVEHFLGTAEEFQDVDAWWAFDGPFGFALDPDHANWLATAFNLPPKTKAA